MTGLLILAAGGIVLSAFANLALALFLRAALRRIASDFFALSEAAA